MIMLSCPTENFLRLESIFFCLFLFSITLLVGHTFQCVGAFLDTKERFLIAKNQIIGAFPTWYQGRQRKNALSQVLHNFNYPLVIKLVNAHSTL